MKINSERINYKSFQTDTFIDTILKFDTIFVCLLAWATISCHQDYKEIPDFSWEGKHIRFATDHEDAEICGGTLQYLDDYTGALKSFFHSGSQEKIDYYWLRHPLVTYDPHFACASNPLGCTHGTISLSKVVPHEHELVHAVRGLDSIGAHPLLEEGAAELWGDDIPEEPMKFSLRDILDLKFKDLSRSSREQYYSIAGHFVSFLVSEYGVDGFIEVSRMTDYFEYEPQDLDVAFSAVYGENLEQVIERYETTYPLCEHVEYRQPMMTTDVLKVPLSDPLEIRHLDILADLNCSNPDVIGPRDGEIWSYLTIEIPIAGSYYASTNIIREKSDPDWDLNHLEELYIRMTRMDGDGCYSPFYKDLPINPFGQYVPLADLEAGKYLLRFTRPADKTATVSLSIYAPILD